MILAELKSRLGFAELREFFSALRGQDRLVARVLRSEGVRWLWPMNRLDEILGSPRAPAPTDEAIVAAFTAHGKQMRKRQVRALEKSGGGARPPGRPDLVAFLSTKNQMASVREGLLALPKEVGTRVYSRLPDIFDTAPFESRAFDTDYRNAATEKALAFIDKSPRLARRLAREGAPARPETVVELALHLFMALDMLEDLRPRVLLLANDHSYPQRCLLAAAHLTGVGTAYIQHASVSPLFPRLDFDCAILDGPAAAETYAACERNGAQLSIVRRRPQVYLAGQMKTLRPADPGARVTGIAYNMLDDVGALNALAAELGRSVPLRLRWHPRQGDQDIARVRRVAEEGAGRITISDPAEEPVEDFLAGLKCLVAGDSSIMLEAAIAGCTTLYHRTSEDLGDDYYGFVAAGLARRATTVPEVVRLVGEAMEGQGARPDTAAVRRYSETFGTPWMGREGELAAIALAALLSGRKPGPPFEPQAISGVPLPVMALPR